MTEVYKSHQQWLDGRTVKTGREYDETCEGDLLFDGESGGILMYRCDGCSFTAALPVGNADPKVRARQRIARAKLPSKYVSCEFETTTANSRVKDAVRDWIASFMDAPLPAPAIYGLPGRGKTHLLVAMCEQLLRRYDVTVRFWPIAKLLDDLQDAFGDDREHSKVWRDATTCDLLALDDIGAEQVTEWRSERLARLVDERYQHDRPILLATNYPPVVWEETLGARTVSRLLGMTFTLELEGDDRRIVHLHDRTRVAA